MRIEARIVIASVDTFLRYAAAIRKIEHQHPHSPKAFDELSPKDSELVETITQKTLEKVSDLLEMKLNQ